MNPSYTEYQICKNNRVLSKKEDLIAQCPMASLYYAANVLQDRFPLGEPTIAKSPHHSLDYALYVINGRFEAGEEAIAEDSAHACRYATDVIKGRFLLGEPEIQKNEFLWDTYVKLTFEISSDWRYDGF